MIVYCRSTPEVQKFCVFGGGGAVVPTLMVELTVGAEPALLAAVTLYVVVLCGAETFTKHEVEEMPPLQLHVAGAPPVLQLTCIETVVPVVTVVTPVFGDCVTKQLPGGVGGCGVPT